MTDEIADFLARTEYADALAPIPWVDPNDGKESAMTDCGAVLSDCGRYRYLLWRLWDESLPRVGFVMLNPSTADATTDDPTIRRCVGFAKAWGFGGLQVANLYAYRATDPRELTKVDDPYGPYNALHLAQMRGACRLLVAAWGVRAEPGDARRVTREMAPLYCLGTTKGGAPKHPLYVSSNTQAQVYKEHSDE